MSAPAIADIITDLCQRGGLDPATQVDVSMLNGSALQPSAGPLGFLVERPVSAATSLRTLMDTFFIDACESDGKIKFVPRGMVPRIVQHKYNGVLISDSTVIMDAPHTPGNLLLAFGNADNSNPAPTDLAGNIWTLLWLNGGGGTGVGIWWAIANGYTGINQITFSAQGFHFSHIDGYVVEIVRAPQPQAPATGTWSGTSIATISAPFGCNTFRAQTHTTSSGWIAMVSLPNGPSTQPLFLVFFAAPSGSNLFPDTLSAGWSALDTGAWSQVAIFQSPFIIPEDDLGLAKDNAELTEQFLQAADLPYRVEVLFNDPDLDYQQGHQPYERASRAVQSREVQILSLPMTLPALDARRIAQVRLYLAWLNRQPFAMNLWRALYMMLDPTDLVDFIYESKTFQTRIKEMHLGQDFSSMLDCVTEDSDGFSSVLIAGRNVGAGQLPPTVAIAANTILFLLDFPLLADTDANPGGTGLYFGLTSQLISWLGGVLNDSIDDVSSDFQQETATNQPLTFGYARAALGSPASPWSWDSVNSITIDFLRGSIAGVTDIEALNGANQLIVGGEVVNFVDAVQNMDGSVTVSRFLRGRRGTEGACASHASGELVMLVPSGLQRLQKPLSWIGILRYFRAVTAGQDITTVPSQTLTPAGNDLKPYAPCHLGGKVDGSGNITITWIRRTRLGGEWQSGPGSDQVPLSEDSEAYDVEILNGLTVVRTVTVPTPTFVYTAVMQTADFGSTQTSVNFNIYQKSAQVGRGFKASGTAPTPGGWPVPAPAVFPTIAGIPVDPATTSNPTDGEVLQYNGTTGALELVAGLNRTEIALAPGAGGNFTVAHGLGTTPKLVLIQMTSDGEIWFQTARYDGTSLYLVASDAGITGFAECYT